MLGPNGEKYNISDANVEAAGGSRGGDNSSLLQGKQQDLTQKYCFVLFYYYLLLPLFSLNYFKSMCDFSKQLSKKDKFCSLYKPTLTRQASTNATEIKISIEKECVDTESFVIILTGV